MRTAAQALAAAALLLAYAAGSARAQAFDLAKTCPGNLIVNGDFETPDTTKAYPPKIMEKNTNSRWGW